MDIINPVLTDILASMNITLNPQWYPLILVGVALAILLCIFFVFSFIRSFLAWMFRIDEQIHAQRDTNDILMEMLHVLREVQLQNEDILEKLYSPTPSKVSTEPVPPVKKSNPTPPVQKFSKKSNSPKKKDAPASE